MKTMLRSTRTIFARVGLTIAVIGMSALSFAIDNPNTPDYVAEFHTKAEKYESAVSESAGNNKEFSEAANRYESFLDAELNTAYRGLQNKLPDAQKVQLQESQKAWLRYRDDETKFIEANWSLQHFGSSSLISRHMYRSSIIRERVEQLLNYLKNY